MSTFLALYRGETMAGAKLVAVTADPTTVAEFAARLLHAPAERTRRSDDPVLLDIERGRRQALRRIAKEAADFTTPLVEVRP